MDKNSERYKKLMENEKFRRREARLWCKALAEHNYSVCMNCLPDPGKPPEREKVSG